MRLVIIGVCVFIGVPLYKLIASVKTVVEQAKKPIRDAELLLSDTRVLVLKMQCMMDQIRVMQQNIERPLFDTINATESTLQDTRDLAVKLQVAADQWTHLVETIELMPVRRRMKQILQLPFVCCNIKTKH